MAYAKKRQNFNARAVHSRTRFSSDRIATLAGKVVMAVIIIVSIALFVAVMMVVMFNPEKSAKMELETLATKYYEEVYYAKLTDYSILDKTKDSGIPTMTARQLILHEPKLGTADYLKSYCDINRTRVKIYPTSPYGKKDYRVEYEYSCEF